VVVSSFPVSKSMTRIGAAHLCATWSLTTRGSAVDGNEGPSLAIVGTREPTFMSRVTPLLPGTRPAVHPFCFGLMMEAVRFSRYIRDEEANPAAPLLNVPQ